MSEKRRQIIDPIGFILSGLLFTAADVKAGHILTASGSILWTLSCVVWMIPLLCS